MAVSRIVTTGGGEPLPSAFVKLDANDAALDARADVAALRLSALERSAYPAGVTLGTVAATFLASTVLAPASLVSRGLAAFAGIGPDQDGKAATVFLTATRFLVLGWEATSSGTSCLRATVFDMASNGAPQSIATLAFQAPISPMSGGILDQYYIWGGVRTADNIARVFYTHKSASNTNVQANVTTLTLDTSTLALSATVDVTGVFTPSVLLGTQGAGQLHRRRGYLCGSFGAFIPRSMLAYLNLAAGTGSVPAGLMIERSAGSSFSILRTLAPNAINGSHSIDRWDSSLFALLHDGYATGGATVARLSLVAVDDGTGGEVASIPLGGGMSGNARLVTLSGSLAVAGYTTGSQYGTTIVARAADNSLRRVGMLSTTGGLGLVPTEILPLGPNRFGALVKGSGWAATLYVYDVNPAAADDASPFSLVATLPLVLGASIASAASGDNVTILAVDVVPGANANRIAIAIRNVTRSVNAVEIFELT
ncbi:MULTISPECIES: hypothetical protein [unclassified Methylobacterium]|uniref:hypothetical protein n=1 Tax=unclassified Methylobacterium TaxID=2615210 RepID=UPI000CAA17CB|nr:MULTISPECIES: hypothetical protein [unclassified Methylobacterium]PIU06629.1 MAG: hypothetical protein COT56_08850 [Methylobacterium sp. CG09_land_8_20_14_0_10_71_15]PIU11329.1 MAG: hypothetical protein COT28_20555 [Methylobacterium sp. CG08_land_8_20_14_0_20_71_15]GBU19009.1 hypothetical protein AwMethylo_32240 [Methylobacterium sp.]